MRLVRLPRVGPPQLLVLLFSVAACGGDQQGYYSACDEPAGLVVGCDNGPEAEPPFTSWDACRKLAACGIILVTEEEKASPEPQDEYGLDRCVTELEESAGDQGDVVLDCVQVSSCAELSATDPPEVDDNANPDPNHHQYERIVGWCGRVDRG